MENTFPQHAEPWMRQPTTILSATPNARELRRAQDEEALTAARTIAGILEKDVDGTLGYCGGPLYSTITFRSNDRDCAAKVLAKREEICRALDVETVHIRVPAGRDDVAIEVPRRRDVLRLGDLVRAVYGPADTRTIPLSTGLPPKIALGMGENRVPWFSPLAGEMKHLLVGGLHGAFMHSAIISLLLQHSPDEMKMILIDLTRVEFHRYEDLPHLLLPPISSPEDAAAALSWAVREAEERQEAFERMGVRYLDDCNAMMRRDGSSIARRPWPHIVIVFNEPDGMMFCDEHREKVEEAISRITAPWAGGDVGVHLIVASGGFSPLVFSPRIKQHFHTRLCSHAPSEEASRLVLEAPGAEEILFGAAEMLVCTPAVSPLPAVLHRLAVCFPSEEDISSVVEFWKVQGTPAYLPGVLSGEDGAPRHVLEIAVEFETAGSVGEQAEGGPDA